MKEREYGCTYNEINFCDECTHTMIGILDHLPLIKMVALGSIVHHQRLLMMVGRMPNARPPLVLHPRVIDWGEWSMQTNRVGFNAEKFSMDMEWGIDENDSSRRAVSELPDYLPVSWRFTDSTLMGAVL